MEVSLAFKTPNEKVRSAIPWRHFLASPAVWACGLVVLGSQWADATLMLGVLKYLKLVYGFTTSHVIIIYKKRNRKRIWLFVNHLFLE